MNRTNFFSGGTYSTEEPSKLRVQRATKVAHLQRKAYLFYAAPETPPRLCLPETRTTLRTRPTAETCCEGISAPVKVFRVAARVLVFRTPGGGKGNHLKDMAEISFSLQIGRHQAWRFL